MRNCSSRAYSQPTLQPARSETSRVVESISRVGVRRMGPNSFQWCPVTGQGSTGTNWSRGNSVCTWGRPSSLWGWRSPGTGCPGRLWSLLLWRYSRPAWTQSCAACCRWPCFSRGVVLDDPQRSLPTPNILGFCDSVTTNMPKDFLFIYWSFLGVFGDSNELRISKTTGKQARISPGEWDPCCHHCAARCCLDCSVETPISSFVVLAETGMLRSSFKSRSNSIINLARFCLSPSAGKLFQSCKSETISNSDSALLLWVS